VLERVRDVIRRQRAHPAQVLREDQLRIQVGERPGVQRVQVAAGREPPLHVLVDRRGAHPTGVAPADHDRLVDPGRGWFITFERDPDQVVGETERIDDLGRGRQQRHQAHAPILPAG
jgi:hypothetical protein